MSPLDLDAVMRLANAESAAPRWGPAMYETFLAPGGHRKQIFVAEEDGRILGFIAGQIILDVCELDSIVVDSGARRRGVGRALLATLCGWARAGCVTRAQLEVRGGNSGAIGFYLSSGFVQDGQRPGYYRNPDEDAVLMSMALVSSQEK